MRSLWLTPCSENSPVASRAQTLVLDCQNFNPSPTIISCFFKKKKQNKTNYLIIFLPQIPYL